MNKKLLKTLGVFCFVMLVLWTTYTSAVRITQEEGTVNYKDNEYIIVFDPFSLDAPNEFNMPSKYKFSTGSRVECTIKVIDILGVRHFKLKDVRQLQDKVQDD